MAYEFIVIIHRVEPLTQTNFPTYDNYIRLEVSQVRGQFFTFAYSQQDRLKLTAVNCYDTILNYLIFTNLIQASGRV